jgi:hypothetical protein
MCYCGDACLQQTPIRSNGNANTIFNTNGFMKITGLLECLAYVELIQNPTKSTQMRNTDPIKKSSLVEDIILIYNHMVQRPSRL